MGSLSMIALCKKGNFGTRKCDTCKDKFACYTNSFYGTQSPRGGSYVFSLPNDETGKAFLKQLRKYINRDWWGIKVRGRHPYRKEVLGRVGRSFGDNDIPLDKADWLVVYLTYSSKKSGNSIRHR